MTSKVTFWKLTSKARMREAGRIGIAPAFNRQKKKKLEEAFWSNSN
jgi:hypothetical protein